MQQTMAVERGPVLRREKCYCHGCITDATSYAQEKGKRRVLQLKEMLQDDIYLNCRKCCIRTTEGGVNSLVNIAHFETNLNALEPHKLDEQNGINNLVECHFICALN